MKALHLGALWALAFVQPLFDLLGGEAQFFVARGSTTLDIVLFALVFTLVPPLVLALLVRLWEPLMYGFVGVLVAAIVLPPLGDVAGVVAIPLAVALGAGAGVLYARAAPARTFLSILSPAPLLFLVLFLFVSPVSELVLPEDAQAVAGEVRSDTPVVMVVFDELPATTLMDARDRVDARRYPAFAALGRDATWYREASTVAGRTTEAVPALLTGQRPREGDLPIAADHPQSLFTLLSRSHRLEVVEPITDVCPADLCREERPGLLNRLGSLVSDLRIVSAHLLLPDDLRDGLPPIDRDWQGFADDAIGPQASREQRARFIGEVFRRIGEDDPPARFETILEAVGRQGEKPPLLFLHTSIPHVPWHYLPDGRQYTVIGPSMPGVTEGRWVGPQWLADQSYQRHLVQTQFADRLLGRLMERLKEAGLYDRALIVVTADHGVSFRSGDWRRRPTPTNVHDVANMPLFVKAPEQREGRIVDGVARTIDVLPTIAREMGIRLRDEVDGVPLGTRGDDPATELDVPDSWELGTTTTFGTFLREREERRAHEKALLAAADYDPFRMGPRPELMGRIAAGSPVRFRLDDPAAYEDVSLDAPVLPAYITGKVSGERSGVELAVTVNGRIAATTRLDGRRFGALVAPDVLRAGENRIGVVRIGSGRI